MSRRRIKNRCRLFPEVRSTESRLDGRKKIMASDAFFVGRKAELSAWSEILADPIGEVVLVAGDPGMGKTALVDQMVFEATRTPRLCCASVRYTVLPTDSSGMVMRMMIEDAFFSARAVIGQLETQGTRFHQWNTVIERFSFCEGGLENRYAFLNALRFDKQKHVFDQFQERLILFSKRMPENGRLIIVLDPEREMLAFHSNLWSRLFRQLPSKINMIIAQQCDDVLLSDPNIYSLPNVRLLPGPEKSKGLAGFDRAEVETLIARYPAPHKTADEIRALRDRCFSNGKPAIPYVARGLFDLHLLADVPLENLDAAPGLASIADAQWKRLLAPPFSPIAEALFKAYAILETPVPDGIARAVAGIDTGPFENLIRHPYIASLLRMEPEGRSLVHLGLADAIRKTLRHEDGSWNEEGVRLHARAARVYNDRLRRSLHHDPLATLRFPEHTFHAEGPEAFLRAIISCEEAFLSLGLYVTYSNLLHRALLVLPPDSISIVDLHYHLGGLRMRQNDNEAAWSELNKALEGLGKHRDPVRSAKVTLRIGKLLKGMRRYQEALETVGRAIDAYRSQADLEETIEALQLLGSIQCALERVAEAEQTLVEALHLCDFIPVQRHRLRLKAGVHCSLGKFHESQNRHADAAEQYNRALDLTQSLYDRETEAGIFEHLRDVQENSGDLRGAETSLLEALKIYEELKMVEEMAESYCSLAVFADRFGNRPLTEERFAKARSLFQQLGNRKRIEEIDRVRELMNERYETSLSPTASMRNE